VFTDSAEADKAPRSMPKRPIHSAAMCCASAALPALPNRRSLRPSLHCLQDRLGNGRNQNNRHFRAEQSLVGCDRGLNLQPHSVDKLLNPLRPFVGGAERLHRNRPGDLTSAGMVSIFFTRRMDFAVTAAGLFLRSEAVLQ